MNSWSAALRLYPENALVLRELGLRDGLQMTSSWLRTESKIEWIRLAADAGVRHFEVGSFLPPSTFPQFADVDALADAVRAIPGAVSSALVLNERGAADALRSAVDEIVVPVSATEAHSMANMRRSRKDAIQLLREVSDMAGQSGGGACVGAAISVAFGCSTAGEVREDEVARLAADCAAAGASCIAVADTVGFAGPLQVSRLCRLLVREFTGMPLKVHLHDTRGTGLANAYAALEEGIRILDGTIGGLGGCPFAPGASGNIVFEDLIFLCERCGYPTGIDLRKLMRVREILEKELPNEPLHGKIAQADVPGTIGWRAS